MCVCCACDVLCDAVWFVCNCVLLFGACVCVCVVVCDMVRCCVYVGLLVLCVCVLCVLCCLYTDVLVC